MHLTLEKYEFQIAWVHFIDGIFSLENFAVPQDLWLVEALDMDLGQRVAMHRGSSCVKDQVQITVGFSPAQGVAAPTLALFKGQLSCVDVTSIKDLD